MGVLEQVVAMTNKGLGETEIVRQLQASGVSPKEITDALNQIKIKQAVSSENPKNSSISGMELSIMANPEQSESLPTEGTLSDEDLTPPTTNLTTNPLGKNFVPLTKEISDEVPVPSEKRQEEGYSEEYTSKQYAEPQYAPQQYSNTQYQDYPQEYTPDEGYSLPQEMPPQVAGDADTIIEIAEQVFIEKIKKLQKQVEDLNEFKTLSQVKIDNISDRLKRIELHIDRLQADILEKVGSYGRGIEGVKKEMGMMQESFGKMVNSIADKAEEKHHQNHPQQHHTSASSHKTHTQKTHKAKKSKK